MHRNPSLVNGDAHPRNIGLDAMENYVLFDFERTGIGAPQFDEARLYAHRDFSISLEEQVKLAKDSAKRRNISDIEGYIAGYHAAVIFKTIEYMSYIYGLAGEKGIENSKAILDKNLEVVRENANALLSEKQASELVAAAKEAFNLDNVFPIKPASVTLSHTSDINMHSYEPKAAEEKPVYALSR